MIPSLGTIIIYARDMKKTAAFYASHFGFETTGEVIEGLIELIPRNSGARILIHQLIIGLIFGSVAWLVFHYRLSALRKSGNFEMV